MVEDKPLRARTTGAGGFELRCASLQGVPCLEFAGTGDCEHTRAVLVRETGGLVAVLDLLREELRESQVEIAALRLAQRLVEEERDIAQVEAMEAQDELAVVRPLADIMRIRLSGLPDGADHESITLEGDRALSSGVPLSQLFSDQRSGPNVGSDGASPTMSDDDGGEAR